MGFRIDDSVNEARAAELERFLALAFDGNNAALGRRLGYRDGSFVGQMLRREKAITEVTWGKVCALREVKPHINSKTPTYPLHQTEDVGKVSHAVSHREPIIALRTVTREGLGVEKFEEPFQMRIDTDELAPDVPRGRIGRFRPGQPPSPGWPVMLRDPDGGFHLRLYREGLGGNWEGYSKQPEFKTFEKVAHGVEIVATMIGSDWA